jgi:hypothetical protein
VQRTLRTREQANIIKIRDTEQLICTYDNDQEALVFSTLVIKEMQTQTTAFHTHWNGQN